MDTFNQVTAKLTGKVVNNDEFLNKIRQNGIDLETTISPKKKMRGKILELIKAGEQPDFLEPTTYLSRTAAEDVEGAVMAVQNEHKVLPIYQQKLDAHKSDLYLDALSVVKSLVVIHDEEKVVAAFIKAAEECTDHRSKLAAGELQKFSDFTVAMAAKLDRKF